MASLTHLTPEAKQRLLAKLSAGWSVSSAAKAAGVHRQTYYDWRNSDPAFASEADEAIEEGTDALEDSATRQAKAGSTTLMVVLLKARRPEKYRERSDIQVGGTGGGPLTVVIGQREDGPQ